MDIIAENEQLLKSFWLYFHINGRGIEWQDEDLPIPTLHKHINRGYYIGYAIDGFFATAKGQEYLNDIIARMLLTMRDYNITRLEYKPTKKDLETSRIYARVYKLQEIGKNLKSLQKKNLIPARADTFEDFTFWAIKLYAEDMIMDSGFIVYEMLENWAMNQFLENKERSTIRAKCRSVFNWYEERDFQIPKKHKPLKQYLEETMATRKEHITRLNISKGEQNKRAVINVITGLFADDYKKKTGAWHFGKIANQVGLSSKTVAKIIKEYEAEQ